MLASSDQADAGHWLSRRLLLEGPENTRPPLMLDVRYPPWHVSADGVFTANTLHIMSWPEVVQLFSRVGEVLSKPGRLCVYGPFRYDGKYTSESNARFDASLRMQGEHMGIRDFEAVDKLAQGIGLSLLADYAMPANNQILVWRK